VSKAAALWLMQVRRISGLRGRCRRWPRHQDQPGSAESADRRRQQFQPVLTAVMPPRVTGELPGRTPRIHATSAVLSPNPDRIARSAASRRARNGPGSAESGDAVDDAAEAVGGVARRCRPPARSAMRTSPRWTRPAASVRRVASASLTHATRPRPPGPGPFTVVMPSAFTSSKTLPRERGSCSTSSASRTPSTAAGAGSGMVGGVGGRSPDHAGRHHQRNRWLRNPDRTGTNRNPAEPEPGLCPGSGVHAEIMAPL